MGDYQEEAAYAMSRPLYKLYCYETMPDFTVLPLKKRPLQLPVVDTAILDGPWYDAQSRTSLAPMANNYDSSEETEDDEELPEIDLESIEQWIETMLLE